MGASLLIFSSYHQTPSSASFLIRLASHPRSNMFAHAVTLLGAAAVGAHALALQPRGPPSTSPGAIGFDWPPLRGWNGDSDDVAPCGGFTLGGRTDFPISGGELALIQQRDGHNIQIQYSTVNDPQGFSDFQPLLSNITHLYGGSACLQTPDFASMGLSAGSPVTFMVTYQTGPQRTNLFQCADVNLVAASGFAPFEDYTCANVTRSTQTRGGANTAVVEADSASSTSGSSRTGTSSGSDSLSNVSRPVRELPVVIRKAFSKADFQTLARLRQAAAGGIGAGVALAAVAGLFAAFYFLGLLKVGKKAQESSAPAYSIRERDDAATLNTVHSVTDQKA